MKASVDKTFGLKNKKGKQVQSMLASARGMAGEDNAALQKRREEMKRAEAAALNALLFTVRSDVCAAPLPG